MECVVMTFTDKVNPNDDNNLVYKIMCKVGCSEIAYIRKTVQY